MVGGRAWIKSVTSWWATRKCSMVVYSEKFGVANVLRPSPEYASANNTHCFFIPNLYPCLNTNNLSYYVRIIIAYNYIPTLLQIVRNF